MVQLATPGYGQRVMAQSGTGFIGNFWHWCGWLALCMALVCCWSGGGGLGGQRPSVANLTCVVCVRACDAKRLAIIWGIGGNHRASSVVSFTRLARWLATLARFTLGSHSVNTTRLHFGTRWLSVCLADRTRGYTIVLSFQVSVGEDNNRFASVTRQSIGHGLFMFTLFSFSKHCHTHNRQKLYTVSRLGSRCSYLGPFFCTTPIRINHVMSEGIWTRADNKYEPCHANYYELCHAVHEPCQVGREGGGGRKTLPNWLKFITRKL